MFRKLRRAYHSNRVIHWGMREDNAVYLMAQIDPALFPEAWEEAVQEVEKVSKLHAHHREQWLALQKESHVP